MTSETDLVNRALRSIGDYRIEDFATSTEPEGDLARDVFHQVRKVCLGKHEWRFARQFHDFGSALSLTPAAMYDYVYALPADFIRIGMLSEFSDMRVLLEEWDIGEIADGLDRYRVLFTNTASVFGTYVRDHTTYDHWSSWFEAYFTAALASEMAASLKSTAEREALEKLANLRLMEARAQDSQNQAVLYRPTGTWLQAMRGSRVR